MELVFTPLLQTLHYTCKVWDICCVHGKFHPNIMLTSSRIFVYLFFPSLGRKTSWQCQYLYYDDDDDDYDFEIWPFHTCPSILRINHTKKKRVPEISKQLDLFILMLALQLSGWASQWMLPSPPTTPQRCQSVPAGVSAHVWSVASLPYSAPPPQLGCMYQRTIRHIWNLIIHMLNYYQE